MDQPELVMKFLTALGAALTSGTVLDKSLSMCHFPSLPVTIGEDQEHCVLHWNFESLELICSFTSIKEHTSGPRFDPDPNIGVRSSVLSKRRSPPKVFRAFSMHF